MRIKRIRDMAAATVFWSVSPVSMALCSEERDLFCAKCIKKYLKYCNICEHLWNRLW